MKFSPRAAGVVVRRSSPRRQATCWPVRRAAFIEGGRALTKLLIGLTARKKCPAVPITTMPYLLAVTRRSTYGEWILCSVPRLDMALDVDRPCGGERHRRRGPRCPRSRDYGRKRGGRAPGHHALAKPFWGSGTTVRDAQAALALGRRKRYSPAELERAPSPPW